MASKNSHLTLEDRMIIEKGLTNESSRKSIADTLGKDKSTICKEVKKHRRLQEPSRSYRSPNGTHDCIFIRECGYNGFCLSACQRRQPVPCKRRDRTVGVCNGCSRSHYCRLPKYYYRAEQAHKEYTCTLTDSRQGIDLTSTQARQIADLILPDLKRGISISAILQAHDELTMSEKTLYNYIEQGVLPGIMNLDLNRKVSRKTDARTRIRYRKRQSYKYLKGRTYTDFQEYLQKHPSASVIEMDTVYNDISNGPFIQTFMIRDLRVLFGVLHSEKTAAAMVSGLESVKRKIGDELFKRFFSIILTDRGTEFTDAEKMEALGCRVFYCDPMQSCQKALVENKHGLLRAILPKKTDLKALGLDSQKKLDQVMSHLNSYPVQSLHNKTPWQWAAFLDGTELLERLGLKEIPYEDLQMNPRAIQK